MSGNQEADQQTTTVSTVETLTLLPDTEQSGESSTTPNPSDRANCDPGNNCTSEPTNDGEIPSETSTVPTTHVTDLLPTDEFPTETSTVQTTHVTDLLPTGENRPDSSTVPTTHVTDLLPTGESDQRSETPIGGTTTTHGPDTPDSSTTTTELDTPWTNPTSESTTASETFQSSSSSTGTVFHNVSTGVPGFQNETDAISAETSANLNQCNISTIGIISGVSVGVLLVVLTVAIVCFFRQRSKWKAKLETEKAKTDIWSLSTFNNTIVNENFADYELATSTGPADRTKPVKSVGVLSQTPAFDPFGQNESKNKQVPGTAAEFNSEVVDVIRRSDVTRKNDAIRRSDSMRRELSLTDTSKMRRNTYSAPDGLGALKKSTTKRQSSSDALSENPRDRSLTYTAGKKHKQDRHVLLRHEQIVEDAIIETLGHTRLESTNTYIVTEL